MAFIRFWVFPWTSELRSFLAVDTSGGRGGDIASLRYPSVHLSNPACLHVEYLIEGDVLLDVLYKVNPHSETKERLCTLEPTDGWESSDVDLPAGLYQLHLDAIFMSLEGARVYIDLIELLDENCTRFQVYGITRTLMTQLLHHHYHHLNHNHHHHHKT